MKIRSLLITAVIPVLLAGCEPNPESTRTTSVTRVASNGLWVPDSKLCDYDEIVAGYRGAHKKSYDIRDQEVDKSIKVHGGNNAIAYLRASYYHNLRLEKINQITLRTFQTYGNKCPQPLHPDYQSDLAAFVDVQGSHAELAAKLDAEHGFSREQAKATNDFLASLSAAAAPSGYAAASGSTSSTQPLYAADNAAGCYKISRNPARHINTCSSDIIISWKNSANSSCQTATGCSLTISANSQRSDDPGNLPTSLFGVTRCFESDWARGLCKL